MIGLPHNITVAEHPETKFLAVAPCAAFPVLLLLLQQVKKTGQTSPVWKSVTTGWSSFNAPYSLRFQSNGRLSGESGNITQTQPLCA